MKIASKKQMRLDELIKYVIEQEWDSVQVTSDNGNDVYFTSDSKFLICDGNNIPLYDTFTVEVEEELTEDAILPTISEVFYDVEADELITENHHCQSINEILAEQDSTIVCLAMFNKVGDSMTTIWTKDAGIPTEGTFKI